MTGPRRRSWDLLWLDGTAGAAAGVVVLALSGWLSGLEGLPRGLLLATGAANLVYASFSLSLAGRARRQVALIQVLAAANGAWMVVCLALAATYWEVATVLGRVHLVGEGFFVGGLGALEWMRRETLAMA